MQNSTDQPPKPSETENVGGFPIANNDVESVVQRLNVPPLVAKSILKESAQIRLVFIFGSILGIVISGIAAPVICFLALKSKKWQLTIFPRVGYYSLAGPLFIGTVGSQFLYSRSTLYSSWIAWIASVLLAYGIHYALYFAQGLKDEMDKPFMSKQKLILFGAMWISSFFIVNSVNRFLDFGSVSEWRVAVTDKQYVSQMEYSSFYQVTTTGKGKVRSIEWQVSKEMYDKLQVGDSVIHFIKPGLFGSPWISEDLKPVK